MPISPNLSNAIGNSTVNIQLKVKMFVVQITCIEGYYRLYAAKGYSFNFKINSKSVYFYFELQFLSLGKSLF
jgi:hypothetical protein